MTAPGVYLSHFLAPVQTYLDRDDVTDIYINRAHELWVETLGGKTERYAVPMLDCVTLEQLAKQVAALTHQGISRQHPLLSASLPDGARIQVIAPPATRQDIAIAIRKQVVKDMSLSQYAQIGAFDMTTNGGSRAEMFAGLREQQAKRDYAGLLQVAVKARCNILVSGGTSSGKTTFLNALVREIEPDERLILIEDTPELALTHDNAIGLLSVRGALGEAAVSMDDLVTASLRMRPDRIILGELRGPEAFTFLRAVNTGHPGSMTSVHADSPEKAIDQIALLILQSGSRLDRESITHFVRSSIDIYVHLDRVGGRRSVSSVEVRA
jgi:type IV secretion system protein VirB11